MSKKSNDNLLGEVYDLAETVLIVFFIVSLLLSYVFRISDVDGPSMENTFITGDKVVSLPLMRNFKTGDVVVANTDHAYLLDDSGNAVAADGLKKTVIKRVIATEGQTLDIDFESGNVTVDGVLLNEPYITGLTHYDEGAFTGQYPFTVPEGYVFVMGDNRAISMDSRSSKIGLISKDCVIGTVMLRVYPFSSFGRID